MIVTPFLDVLLATLAVSMPTETQTPSPLLPTRPRDPFVFRCVLDRHARMITAALDDDMWVAWDATNCGLYEAWKGGVRFDGPVYTTVHGPQPTVRGTAYTTGAAGAVWTAYEKGQPIRSTASYGGYRIDAGRLTLEWRIALPGDRVVVVNERPEFVRPSQFLSPEQIEEAAMGKGGQPGLQRVFEAVGMPADVSINVTVRTDGAAAKLAGALERERFEDVKDDHGVVVSTRVWSQLPLSAAAPRNSVVLFFAPITTPPPAAKDKAAKPKQDPAQPKQDGVR